MENANISIRNIWYCDADPLQLTELYTRLEILRPVTIQDAWDRRKFRAQDICHVCNGDKLIAVSRNYAYGA